MNNKLHQLAKEFEGEILYDKLSRIIYSTDASAYKEEPIGVAYPKTNDDIKKLISFASANAITLIPRATGTSLAGQVVGKGLVVDITRYLNKIIELNIEEKWVVVQSGVVLEELNKFLAPHGLFFGPETSTANRCTIGGMLGNNACGLHSLVYGSTRDHTLSVKTILSDGSEAEFGVLTKEEFEEKCQLTNLEGKIYSEINDILSNPVNQYEIINYFPDLELKRRNTGYAIDLLMQSTCFVNSSEKFNMSKLLAGSEGTLAFTTEIKLNLINLPPKDKAVVCVHFAELEQAFNANLIALKYKPMAVELMDKTMLDCTKGNIEQAKNRFFVKDNPEAILIIEFAAENIAEINDTIEKMEAEMKRENFGYHFPVVYGNNIKKVWNLRKAGLGVLSNVPGDAKPVSVLEDTAVSVKKWPLYMRDFKKLLAKYNLNCVYHAHIGTGELHLRPMLNLKNKKDVELFHLIALETAKLVKHYKGSLSGEHGDGRLRGEFISIMVGEHNFKLMHQVKEVWDPNNIFNAEKIINTPKMNTSLRFAVGSKTREIETIFDFEASQGIIRAAEKCNGSADCRKSAEMGGTMCPSFQATRDEKNVTRARANVLREFLSNSTKENPFDHQEIYEILDLCLSCKACKSECPSSVDIAKMKAEFLQHYYDAHGIPLRSRMIAEIPRINKLGSVFPAITNFFMRAPFFSNLLKKQLNIAAERDFPLLAKQSLLKWAKKNRYTAPLKQATQNVYLFCDEFTNFNDPEIGIKTIRLLTKLGYQVLIPKHIESGRSDISKGLIRKAQKIAAQNVELLSKIVSEKTPLIGIEPSAILTFRDEYPELLRAEQQEKAKILAANTFTIEEFIANEIEKGNIKKEAFTKEIKNIKLHGHCQQKAIASTNPTKIILSFPENYSVEEIPSGCCGMAGSFGFEKEHYKTSMNIGELVLFPAIRNTSNDTIIAAAGTSCRHQIKDGTQRTALHPVEILFDALVI